MASIAHTQFVLYELAQLSVDIPISTWLSTTLKDVVGLLPGYGAIIMIGLLLGFTIMAAVNRWTKLPKPIAYAIAGALSLAMIHLLMHPLFNITLIAGARSFFGLICQILCGALGGFVFGKLAK